MLNHPNTSKILIFAVLLQITTIYTKDTNISVVLRSHGTVINTIY